jgi:hypothetical protein
MVLYSRLKYKLGSMLVLCLMLSACEIINPDEEIPAYVRIQRPEFNPQLITNPAEQILDGWLTIDKSDLIGGFELPATVPVLNTGTGKIVSISAGVKSDGQSGVRIEYPFYTIHQDTLDLTPTSENEVRPVFQYLDNLEFPLNETFDLLTNQMVVLSPYAGKNIEKVYTAADEFTKGGIKYGYVQAETGKTDPIIWASQNTAMKLPKGGSKVFLEVNYKSSLPIELAVSGTNYYSAQLTAFPTPTWTKLYVDLLEEISLAPSTVTEFRLQIKSANTSNTGTDYVAIDNVRLVHFKQ